MMMKKILMIVLMLCSAASAYNRVGVGIALEGGLGGTDKPGSRMFDGYYEHYHNAHGFFGGFVGGGATLNLLLTRSASIATGVSYRGLFMGGGIYPDANRPEDTVKVDLQDHVINIPAVIRLRMDGSGNDPGFVLEAGVLWGFPFSTSAKVKSGEFGVNDRHSGFRAEQDIGVVLGFGRHFEGRGGVPMWMIFRGVIPLTWLDTHNAIGSPLLFGIALDIPVFGF